MIERIAISMTRGVTPDLVRRMQEEGIGISDFFSVSSDELATQIDAQPESIPPLSERKEALLRAKAEAEFCNRHNISPIFLNDEDYPRLLAEIPDAPVLIYKLGEADLNGEHFINMVGTRRCTGYGIDFCNKMLADLAPLIPDVKVVSGLAYGIDAAAHNAALANGLTTIAVVAHGLDTIYPAGHRQLAKEIISQGGAIISEYPSGTTPFPRRFLERNRIVAGLCEVTVVVESEIKGGAMSTANLAFSYMRDVMAVPGRVNDRMSTGTNHLISREKARILCSHTDIIEVAGWRIFGTRLKSEQKNLFPELSGDSGAIYDALRFKASPMTVDAIHAETRIPLATLIATLTELEFDGIVMKLPGSRYSLA